MNQEFVFMPKEDWVAVLDGVRNLTGKTDPLTVSDLKTEIEEELPELTTPTLQNKAVTPTANTQTVAADSGYDGLDTVTVNAIPDSYVEPTATKGATVYTPTTSKQTIAAGTYLTGTQTIAGDSNLVAENIAEGVSIFGVEGTHSGGGDGESSTSSVSKKDVNFYDYDGTILYSYTTEEAQALTALPTLPSHGGLICQGWNLSLDYIKTYSWKYGVCDAGAMYITDDGKTRLYIRIAAEGRMTVPLYFSQTVANGVTIDWGDGSSTQTLSGTGNKNTSHTYASIGDYVIALEVTSGTLGLGVVDDMFSYCVMGRRADSQDRGVYCNMPQKIEIGSGVTGIGEYAFYDCRSLSSITIPNSVTSIGSYAFQSCCSLNSIVIPNSVTSIDSYAFQQCYSLASITIPDGVTSISNYAFQNCCSLASIVIPDSVTSIGNSIFQFCYSFSSIVIPDSVTRIGLAAFNNCYGMAIYDFTSHTSVPTLSATTVFTNIPSDCIIKVPSALYNSWIAATNWSTYASKIVAV